MRLTCATCCCRRWKCDAALRARLAWSRRGPGHRSRASRDAQDPRHCRGGYQGNVEMNDEPLPESAPLDLASLIVAHDESNAFDAVVPPIVQTSLFTFSNYDEMISAYRGE